MRSAYCLGYQHWTVIPHHMEEAFADMVETGFEAVCFSFCESEMRYARRAFELQVNLAQKAGLKVFVVPSRLGGALRRGTFDALMVACLEPGCHGARHRAVARGLRRIPGIPRVDRRVHGYLAE